MTAPATAPTTRRGRHPNSVANLKKRHQAGIANPRTRTRGRVWPRFLILQEGIARAFSAGPFSVRQEHVGKSVWVLPERPTQRRMKREGVRQEGMAHAVVVDVDRKLYWPEPRYAFLGMLELTARTKRVQLPRVREYEDAIPKLRHVRVSSRTSMSIGEQLKPHDDRSRIPHISLVGDWIHEAGFNIGDVLERDVSEPGTLILRRVIPRLPVFATEARLPTP